LVTARRRRLTTATTQRACGSQLSAPNTSTILAPSMKPPDGRRVRLLAVLTGVNDSTSYTPRPHHTPTCLQVKINGP
jgi:hypothetical protein